MRIVYGILPLFLFPFSPFFRLLCSLLLPLLFTRSQLCIARISNQRNKAARSGFLLFLPLLAPRKKGFQLSTRSNKARNDDVEDGMRVMKREGRGFASRGGGEREATHAPGGQVFNGVARLHHIKA